MEQLIILVIMLALGSLFGKKKEKPEEKKPPQQRPVHTQTAYSEPVKREPQRSNAAPQNKSRSLKELSRDLFEDIQKEFKDLQQETQQQAQPQTEIFYPEAKPQPKAERPARPAKPASSPRPERQSGRLRAEKQSQAEENERILQEDLIPKTPKQVMQGIVYAEILGPPKSKR